MEVGWGSSFHNKKKKTFRWRWRRVRDWCHTEFTPSFTSTNRIWSDGWEKNKTKTSKPTNSPLLAGSCCCSLGISDAHIQSTRTHQPPLPNISYRCAEVETRAKAKNVLSQRHVHAEAMCGIQGISINASNVGAFSFSLGRISKLFV